MLFSETLKQFGGSLVLRSFRPPVAPSAFSGTGPNTHGCANTHWYTDDFPPPHLYLRIGKDTLSLGFVVVNVSVDFWFCYLSTVSGEKGVCVCE